MNNMTTEQKVKEERFAKKAELLTALGKINIEKQALEDQVRLLQNKADILKRELTTLKQAERDTN